MTGAPLDKARLPVWTPAPPGPGERVYPGIGLRTRPAPPGLATRVTAEQARAAADGEAIGARGEPDVALRLVTTGDHPPGTRVADRLTEHPAWVVTYPDARPAPLHGRRRGPSPVVDLVCESTFVVDAATGAMILNAQTCGPRNTDASPDV